MDETGDVFLGRKKGVASRFIQNIPKKLYLSRSGAGVFDFSGGENVAGLFCGTIFVEVRFEYLQLNKKNK